MRAPLVRFCSILACVAAAACTSSSVTPQPASSASTAQPGSIERMWNVTTISKAAMGKGLIGSTITELGGAPQCDVRLVGILYHTTGVHGEPADASAAFMIPLPPCKGPFPLVGYAHGTNPVKEQLITDPKTTSSTWTAPDQSPVVVAAIFAAHGYAVAATDYLGLGLSTYPYHPYLHAASEATAVIDSILAARTAAAHLKIRLNGQIFLAGHSQGGQSTVASQRAIEASYPQLHLAAVGASSGPYALSQTFEDSLRRQSQDAPILAAYILPGYHKIYGNIYDDPSQIFKEPWAAGIDSLLPVATYQQEAKLYGKTLPLKLAQLLRRSFVQSFLNDPNSDARKDTADNDLLGGWTPKAPLFLCGGDRDPEVEYKNAREAYAYFKKRGADVRLLDVNSLVPPTVPIVDYHVVVAILCLPVARTTFFDPVRRPQAR